VTNEETRLAVTSGLNQYAPVDLSTLSTVACCSREDALLALYELAEAGYARVVLRGSGEAAGDLWGWAREYGSEAA
jgi:hypothetical protein